ncbi:hypothetical protein GF406_00130 [candidate division KSB1 bacterium]|nr:hypothetical protein [candidate division KSB1 bacterium]
MKAFKWILVGLLGLVVLFFLIAQFLPDSYRVEHSVTIKANVERVYDVLTNFNLRRNWDPWIEEDPDATTRTSGNAQGLGAVWSWQGEQVGTGQLMIVETVPGERIESELKFTEPREMESSVIWDLRAQDSMTTRVNWLVEGTLDYPTERYFGLVIEDALSNDMKRGLQNLKRILESAP